MVALLRHTRADSRLYLGGSPRAGILSLSSPRPARSPDGRDHLAPHECEGDRRGRRLSHRLIVAPEGAAGTTSVDLVATRSTSSRPGLMLTRRGRSLLVLGGALYVAAWAFGSQAL